VTFLRTGDLSAPVNVTYDITAESATPGADFIGESGVTRFEAGSDQATVTIGVVNDDRSEATEVFAVSLVSVDSGSISLPRTMRVNILDDENPVLPPVDPPLVSNYDVTLQRIAERLDQPINMEIAPTNPNVAYVAQKGGVIRTVDLRTGADLGVFLDLSREVNEAEDRGLIDIALHPDFLNNPYIYAFYVVDPPELKASELDQNLNRYSHLVRFTADAAQDYLKAVPGSGIVLLGDTGKSLADIAGGGLVNHYDPVYKAEKSSEQTLNPANPVPVVNGFKQDYLKVDAQSHAGGALAFGPDGMLYVSTGDGTSPNYADRRSPHVQSLDSLSGKILRIDPMTGAGLPDNPFHTPDISPDSNKAKVWQFGLRNPFSMGFDDDGRLFISETGWNAYEEINSGLAGANFGWPWYEGGPGGVLIKTSGYKSNAAASVFYSAVENGTVAVTAPYASFGHAEAAPGFANQSITGGSVIYDGARYPAEFAGDYFYTDFSRARIFTVDTDNRQDIKYLTTTDGVLAPVHFMQGPDGWIYFVELGGRQGFDNDGVIGRLLITAKDGDPPPPPPPPPTGDNLLVNGSFEGVDVPQGDTLIFQSVPGWRAIAGGSIELWRSHKKVTPTDGLNSVELDAGAGWDGFQQDVQTTAGAAYDLSFDAMLRPSTYPWTNGIEVLWNGVLVGKVTPEATWREFSLGVIGTGGLDRLTIQEVQKEGGNGRGAMLDDFSLVEQSDFLFG